MSLLYCLAVNFGVFEFSWVWFLLIFLIVDTIILDGIFESKK